MANREHLAKLREGVDAWNAWRKQNPEIVPDLVQANLIRANLSRADLSKTNLKWANLKEANLNEANLGEANLNETALTKANLLRVNYLTAEQLSQAKTLYGASLDENLNKGVKDICPHLLEKPDFFKFYEKRMDRRDNSEILGPLLAPIITVLMLLAAIFGSFSYEYYMLLRFVVCLTAAYIMIVSFHLKKWYLILPSVFIIVLFNPFIPFHLEKKIWILLDASTAIFIGIFIATLVSSEQK